MTSPRPSHASRPVGIVDIGSNSVRLVIYDGASRAPATLFNEKALCAIGRNMVTTGRLDDEGMTLALETLSRFRALADAAGVKKLDVVATAAVRDAKNGKEFVVKAEAACGIPVRVLSGEEEAELAALGVISGIPDADGIVGDLGGGSLELIPVAKGETKSPGVTLPFGPLRLMDASDGRIERAKDIVDEGLENTPVLDMLKGKTLYAVGGVWRNLARIHMEYEDYPLHVLQHYELERSDALKLAQFIATQSRKSLEGIPGVPKRRIEAIPYGAVVMARLLKATEIERVVVSAFGVREGMLYAKLDPAERALDPLLETCRAWALREGRAPELGSHVFDFLSPLFEKETQEEKRLRRAACLISDIGWRNHPDYRAELTFREVTQGQIPGVAHAGRMLIAVALYHRYGGESGLDPIKRLAKLLPSEWRELAARIGAAARLAYNLTGPTTTLLAGMALKLTEKTVTLTVPSRLRDLLGEPVQKRMDALAESFDRSPRIEIR